MLVDFYLISGMMIGAEFVHLDGEDDLYNGIVIDLLIFRIMFLW
jgi:hypothetical protein